MKDLRSDKKTRDVLLARIQIMGLECCKVGFCLETQVNKNDFSGMACQSGPDRPCGLTFKEIEIVNGLLKKSLVARRDKG